MDAINVGISELDNFVEQKYIDSDTLSVNLGIIKIINGLIPSVGQG